ncbi:probable cytochrome P450 28a5 [Episyrphus balteatus]|uniref:probable cytochrome P450 28a5 n=1 Tax=Episyrphus balteatus TaxID=286459 RepID=UPI00248609F0|nr:probable cytochrome P450 28a5 [Episyrphus balteatus]
MLEVIISVFVILSISIYVYLRWNFDYWQKRGIRGPKPAILVGNFSKSARGEVNYVDELNEIYLKYKNTDKFVGIFASRNPRLFILDPEIVRQILLTNFSSFYDNESSRWSMPKIELLRMQSPFVCVGETWKEKRSEIVTGLTVSRLRSSYPAMQEVAHKLTGFLRDHERKNIDAKELSGRFTLELIANFIWGIDAGAFGNEKLCHIHDIAIGMISQSIKCVSYYLKTASWPWLRKLYTERFFPKSTDDFFKNLTTNLIEHRLKNPQERSDILNHLINLSNKKTLTEFELAGHSTTVLIDGFETAALTISHCLLLIGRNKSVQEKLRNEILEHLDSENGISFEKLNELPYLDQCIHETLRLFPPLATFTKICTIPTTIENSDGTKLQLKRGDTVHISAYSFHKDEEIFEKPEEFIPERFDPEVGVYRKYRDRCVFLPFGDGPRMCLGMKLGLLETKIAVAEIIRNFNIVLSGSTRLDNRCDPNNVFSSLDGGIRLQFETLK